ncbi:hypothetical protein E1B28_000634 [Marasmius oreades]|uniref:Uncharacterized protein n=1 Tax=Marasmius oreades TaxID=181124 RepID=A0A9P7V1P7_9AGAR|nr:uncharacterized protein E1B28_000634 [Marasmius oreades]KAG7098721.1 hypothetical protein E1B28_000634 [Marasmius oreades]
MATYNYIDPVNANLVCCICRMPFIYPYTTTTCAHTFCRDCITKSLETTSQCPIDRLPLREANLQPAGPIIRSLVDELLVECVNRHLGCMHTCQRQLMPVHISNSCPFESIPCPDQDCKEMIFRKDANQHRDSHKTMLCNKCGEDIQSIGLKAHGSACSGRFTTCEFCESELEHSMQASHLVVCQEITVACTHDIDGCAWEGKRSELSAHLTSCAYHAISGFFAINKARITALEDENAVLKRRVDTLEALLRMAGCELQAAKIALGPWYHYSLNLHPQLHLPTELPFDLQPSSASTSQNGSDEQVGDNPVGPSSVPSEHPDILASFFPNEDLPDLPRLPAPPRVPSISSTTSSQGWESFTVNNTGIRQNLHNAVAPLNLSTTLEGSLEALRQSIVTISTSLDSLGRRNDIALTNETFRINEEIMSLKANMHGLRMQVHAILMDRNAQVIRRVQDSQDGWPAPQRFPGSIQSSGPGTKL